MKIVQFAKDHPYLTGGGVLVGGLVIVLILTSGGGNSAEINDPYLGYKAPDNSAAIAANSALAQYQLSAQVAAKNSDNALAKAQSENDTLFKIASKSADVQNNANILNAEVSKASIAADTTKALYAKETTLGVASFQYQGVAAQAASQATIAMGGFDRDKFVATKAAEIAGIGAATERDIASIVSNRDITINGQNVGRDVLINSQNNATKTHELNLNAAAGAAQIALDRDIANQNYMLGAYKQTSENMLRFARK